jgi:hypothetical protein
MLAPPARIDREGNLMGRRLLVASFAILLVGAALAVAKGGLSGTFKTTLSGGPPALNGKWQLKFSGPHFAIRRNGTKVVQGRVNYGAGKLTLTDTSGSYACSGAHRKGTYRYKLSAGSLTFTVVKDSCSGRKAVMTTKAYRKG